MAADLAAFRARFPKFADIDDPDVENALDEALMIHDKRELATLYCAAHLLTLAIAEAAKKTPKGEVTMRRVGPMTAHYRTQALDGPKAFFTTTAYGRRFLNLEGRTPRALIGARVVG